ncbi:hypothetical protein EYF80_016461 [Liparis tanakae]|uniref:Uncharacterized protein n=1 Tax=Liparis tanakae TaxID=230148 RepID=A0A4Z2I5R1_9TELE|nr:hypothetical protein EYF80_016461 [Liparis tanakae]
MSYQCLASAFQTILEAQLVIERRSERSKEKRRQQKTSYIAHLPTDENNKSRVSTLNKLHDLEDGFLVDGQAGIGILAEALSEGPKCQQTLRIDLEQNARWMLKSIPRVKCCRSSSTFTAPLTSENIPSPNHSTRRIPWGADLVFHAITIPGHQEKPFTFPHTSSPPAERPVMAPWYSGSILEYTYHLLSGLQALFAVLINTIGDGPGASTSLKHLLILEEFACESFDLLGGGADSQPGPKLLHLFLSHLLSALGVQQLSYAT